MPKLALKPDSSFFRKIALGAVGSRAAASDLATLGHDLRELERGSLDTKLWKDVKRKRVRVPDLVCLRCGMRVESRAKSDASLSMSHSTVAERSWDFGMVDNDVIAFPICAAIDRLWTAGRLGSDVSYWHERDWVRWKIQGRINYFSVRAFRATPYTSEAMKGVTEGSETTVTWHATFATQPVVIESVNDQKLTVRFERSGRRHSRNVSERAGIIVVAGQKVEFNELLASAVPPLTREQLECPRRFAEPDHIQRLFASRERTQRFTGIKLARLLDDAAHVEVAKSLLNDAEEDIYIRLEAASYLVAVGRAKVETVFTPFLESTEDQTRLEAVIALGETEVQAAVELLAALLHDGSKPYFLRSAAAFCLGRLRYREAAEHLVSAFADVDLLLREEALQAVVAMGSFAFDLLADRLSEGGDVGSGAAEALRQQQAEVPEAVIAGIAAKLQSTPESIWRVWLLGHTSRDRVAAAIADLQEQAPEAHYALTVLWSFTENWIARHWELNPSPVLPSVQEADEV